MIHKLRRGLYRFFTPPCPGSGLKGTMHRVISVKSPAPMFSQAIFILREDVSPQLSRRQLIRQARQAAADMGGGRPRGFSPLSMLLGLVPGLLLFVLGQLGII